MAQPPMNNYLLNTENYEPVFRASSEISKLVRENDAIIARLNALVDLSVRLPQPSDTADKNHAETVPTKITEQSKDNVSQSGLFASDGDSNKELTIPPSKEPAGSENRTNKFEDTAFDEGHNATEESGDYLRAYLEQQLKVDAIPCDKFDRVQNTRVRQLLQDNFRLQQIRDQKLAANRQLLEIHTKYQQLLKEVAIPRLSQDVYKHSISQCQTERQAVEESTKQTNSLWKAYHEYLEVLEKIRETAQRLVASVAIEVDDAAVAQLHMQLDIIVRLKSQLDKLSLARLVPPPSGMSH